MKETKIFDFKINHRNWEESAAILYSLLVTASPGDVISLTGPSRGGKTRLIEYVLRLLFPNMSAIPPGKIPYVMVDAVNSGPNGTFSTKAFTLRLLQAVKHPFYSINPDDTDEMIQHKTSRIEKTTENTFRAALERAFINAGVMYLFIDEAQHARYVSSGALGGYAVLDSWKCFAKSVNIVLVIVGAYPMLKMLHNSPHMLGRKHQVHLARYSNTPEDILEFRRIIQVYNHKLTEHGFKANLDEHCKILHDGSLGCIGLLRAWLFRSQAIASIKDKEINKKILLQTMHPDLELAEISREIMDGEWLLQNGHLQEKPSDMSPIQNGSRSTTKPFQRKPKRFQIGGRSD